MNTRTLILRAALPVVAAVLVLTSCAKKNDPVYTEPAENYAPPIQVKPGDTTSTVTNYDYASLSDQLQFATYTTFISFDKEYYLKNNHANIEFSYRANAHMMDALIDGYQLKYNKDFLPKIKALMLGIKDQNGDAYPNAYMDDMGFLANACMRAYASAQDAEYLTVAKLLYFQIKYYGLNNTADGGVAAVKDQLNYKTTAATANLCILAARLYRSERNAADLTQAKTLYDWLKLKLVLPTGEVMNGINLSNDGYVNNDVFTYNQGLFIGAALEMFNVTGDRSYLQDAVTTANNSLTDIKLLSNGIWKNEGQGDAGAYKGILARYMTALIEVGELDNTNRKKYADFMQKHAQMLYNYGIARPSLMVSPDWSVLPGSTTDITTQVSGIVMMEAAARLKTKGYIQ